LNFSKELSSSGQKANEEMLNVPCHKENEKQNHVKTSLLSEWLWSRTQTTNVDKEVGNKEPSYIVGGNVN
jgi:hypothetical protein